MMAINKTEIMRMANTIIGALDYGSDDLFTSAVITSILTGIPFSEEEIRLLVEQEAEEWTLTLITNTAPTTAPEWTVNNDA